VSEGILFAIGSVVFLFVTGAVLMFGYHRFEQLYRRDQAVGGGPAIVTDGTVEFYASEDDSEI
jgi:hypothetical protein